VIIAKPIYIRIYPFMILSILLLFFYFITLILYVLILHFNSIISFLLVKEKKLWNWNNSVTTPFKRLRGTNESIKPLWNKYSATCFEHCLIHCLFNYSFTSKCNIRVWFGNNDISPHAKTSCHPTRSRRCKYQYIEYFLNCLIII